MAHRVDVGKGGSRTSGHETSAYWLDCQERSTRPRARPAHSRYSLMATTASSECAKLQSIGVLCTVCLFRYTSHILIFLYGRGMPSLGLWHLSPHLLFLMHRGMQQMMAEPRMRPRTATNGLNQSLGQGFGSGSGCSELGGLQWSKFSLQLVSRRAWSPISQT